MRVHPEGPEGASASLVDIIAQSKRQGLSLPLLLRFDGILRHRLGVLSRVFRNAAEEYGWKGRHRPVYPIKVNQQRHVVETLLEAGADIGLGLEVGSKPELLAVVAQLERPSLMICNGYKDEAYMEMACLAVRLGHEVVVVIEKPSEIETFSRVVDREGRNAAPYIGLRSRLAAAAAGSRRPATAPSSASRPTRWSRPSSGSRTSACSTACACSTSTSAARSRPSGRGRRCCARPAACSSSCARWAARSTSSTWAGAWPWTTTAAARASTAR
jgi:hypothetical protein